jgi:hypothetical protein
MWMLNPHTLQRCQREDEDADDREPEPLQADISTDALPPEAVAEARALEFGLVASTLR